MVKVKIYPFSGYHSFQARSKTQEDVSGSSRWAHLSGPSEDGNNGRFGDCHSGKCHPQHHGWRRGNYTRQSLSNFIIIQGDAGGGIWVPPRNPSRISRFRSISWIQSCDQDRLTVAHEILTFSRTRDPDVYCFVLTNWNHGDVSRHSHANNNVFLQFVQI